MKRISIIADEWKLAATKAATRREIVIDASDDARISDGYHSMDEIYEHRISLFIALARKVKRLEELSPSQVSVWRSRKHSAPSDGKDLPMYEGWYVMGIMSPACGQISYHLPLTTWDETHFAETLEYAPDFDGHTSKDVLLRLMQL